jgi:cobalamin synthase
LRRIPGLTGDSYGALCELTELAVLLLFTTGIIL